MHDDRAMDYYESCSAETISNAVSALGECQALVVKKDTIVDSWGLEGVRGYEIKVRKYSRNGFTRREEARL